MTRKIDKDFKLDALKYHEDNPHLTVADVCRNLGISSASFYKWKKEAKENGGEIKHVGSGNYSSDLQKENAQLKRQLRAHEDALNILKKAMGILAKDEHK